MATFLNVAGLAVAFAVFIVILIQVRYERNFDRCHPTAGRIFRVDRNITGMFSTILPRGFIEAVIHSSPHIEAGTVLRPSFGMKNVYLSVEKEGERFGTKEGVTTCSPVMPKMFEFPILEGDINCLEDPEKVMIPESIALKLYGQRDVVGKSIKAEEAIWTKTPTHFTIGAVYRDFPENTQLDNDIYTAIDADLDINEFGPSNYICYLLLDDAASAQDVKDNFNSKFDFSAKMHDPELKMGLVPLTDIYYLDEEKAFGVFRSGNREVTDLLVGIALLIIVVAGINFTNFSTALTPLRIKSINTQKVLGSSQGVLRRALLIEAVLISLTAWLVSLCLVYGLDTTQLLPFVEADLNLLQNLPVVLISGIIALVTGVVAGLYPSYYVTSFPPALVLKGSFGLSPSGRKLRTILIGIQYVVSIILIIGSCFINLQNGYMRKFSLGFDKDQVAIVELNATLYAKHRQTYVNKLKEFSGIEDVAFSVEKIGAKDGYCTNGGTFKEKEFSYFFLLSSYNILKVLGTPVTEGRDFSRADELSDETSYIFSRSAQVDLDMQAGDIFETFQPGHIIGFIGDLKLTSLRNGDKNIAFAVGNFDYPMTVSYIRLKVGTDIQEAVGHIRKVMKELDPSYPFEIEFYDDIFNQLYHKEEALRGLITVFSLLAILISLVGVFGLVIFDTQYRRKEIGVRKVHGATVGEILIMFNKAYLRLIVVCFVIAVPVAWMGVKSWLEGFVYKVPVYWWVFAVALFIVSTVTLLTVTFQNWKAANANPVDSLKSE